MLGTDARHPGDYTPEGREDVSDGTDTPPGVTSQIHPTLAWPSPSEPWQSALSRSGMQQRQERLMNKEETP